jgi:hypothetical protein
MKAGKLPPPTAGIRQTARFEGTLGMDLVLEAIGQKRDSAGTITTWARSNGAPGIGISEVDRILNNLARAGKIRLRVKRRPQGADRWERTNSAGA